jgi:predicted CoA-binding protein
MLQCEATHQIDKSVTMNQFSASSASDDMTRILTTCRTVAVVGLSPKPERDSFRVSRYMQAQGWRVIPVNPVVAAGGGRILGEVVYATLTEAAQAEKVDLVDVFRNSDDVPPVVDEAISLGLPALWLQLGISNDVAIARAKTAGMLAVQNRCLMVEHARLSG